MFYYTYVLRSTEGKKLYIGWTDDLKSRASKHNRGLVLATKDRRPLKLIHYEYFVDKHDAEAREKFLKSGFGRNQLKLALNKTLQDFSI